MYMNALLDQSDIMPLDQSDIMTLGPKIKISDTFFKYLKWFRLGKHNLF